MCITCGCASHDPRLESDASGMAALKADGGAHWHQHADGAWHSHEHGGHDHGHAAHGHGTGNEHDQEGAHIHGAGPHHDGHDDENGRDHDSEHGRRALDSQPGAALQRQRLVRIERDVLAKNDAIAARNRQRLAHGASLALNLVSSPGAGKTTLLCRTIKAIGGRYPVVVVEGDQQTSLDADRIRATGAPALQINTGKGCHLDAAMTERALAQLDPPKEALVMIENVGNLVCPAAFDLGEDAKVVVLSVTEGDDKPLKYPDMFAAAQLMLINKIDLQPYCDFDLDRALALARRVNPAIETIAVCARDGTGFDAWLAWIDARRQAKLAPIARQDAAASAAC
jgi:hydrogenase nickel incorporation protein HypB